MPSISPEEFLLWEKKQLSKGGDKSSFYFLLQAIGGISSDDINFVRVDTQRHLYFEKSLKYIESIWDNHINQSNPIQYLCGLAFWRDLKLKVSEKVLIPRPETELIVDIVLNLFGKNSKRIFFAELGTGSGAISIALALAKPFWEGVATDIDKYALDVASENFIHYSNKSNLRFICGNWLNPLKSYKGEIDLIISNPPYIPKNIYQKLPKEVKNFEPKIALLGGEDGLEHIREIILCAPNFLKDNGWLIIENHFDQGAKVRQLFLENSFTSVEVLKDLSGIGRFTIGRYK